MRPGGNRLEYLALVNMLVSSEARSSTTVDEKVRNRWAPALTGVPVAWAAMARRPPLGARLCDQLLFSQQQQQQQQQQQPQQLDESPASSTVQRKAQEEEAAAGAEEAPSARERAHWVALGLGCTWFINDSMFLQLPYWVASQPEGLKLGGNISFVASVANPVTVAVALLLRRFAFRATMRGVVPVLICFSLAAGGVLACGSWRLSSYFIYLAVVLASTVGGLTPWLTIPWLLHSGYKPALVSPLFLGGSLGSLTSAVLAIWQSPGEYRRFSPSAFFAIVTVPIFVSLLACARIQRHGIGLSSSQQSTGQRPAGAGVAMDGDSSSGVVEERRALLLPSAQPSEPPCPPTASSTHQCIPMAWAEWLLPRGWRRWLGSALPLAAWIGIVTMCTWSVSRAVMVRKAHRLERSFHADDDDLPRLCSGRIHSYIMEEGAGSSNKRRLFLEQGFSAAHTVIGHHACAPDCAAICAALANETVRETPFRGVFLQTQ